MKRLLALITLIMLVSACTEPAAPQATIPNPNPTPDTTTNPTASPADAAYLPDPQLTPGDTLNVTKDDVCTPGYASKVRDVPEAVKQQAYQRYGITSHKPGEYEVDHLISLELGGSNAIQNLWPESYSGTWNAHIKDRLENELHRRICSGELDMRTAQRAIATDWIAAYRQYVGALK
jgi:hypothetical protein